MEYTLQYRLMGGLEIKERSAALINKNAGVRFLDADQADGTLCDRKLGPATQLETCRTCGKTYAGCLGHFGHIELILPVIPLFTLPYVLKEYKKQHKNKKITTLNNELIIHNKDGENTVVTAFDLLKEDYDKWDKFIIQNMVVVATNKRPYTIYKKGEYRADYLTQLYAKIISCNASEKSYGELKKAINAFYDIKHGESNSKKGKTIHERIDGKFGRVKANIIGSRVNYTARAVVTCDPTLKLDEVGVPESFCKKLTTPDFVFADNLETIKKNKHKYKYYQEAGSHDKRDLRYFQLDDINPGDILHRPLEDDDWVAMNRQPSLHPNSFLGFRVRVRKGTNCFSLCLSACPGFNLDFDGDEMNMHVPQTLDAQIDCALIMSIKNNMLSHQNGGVMTGLIYDAVLGIYELTKNNVVLDERMVGDICCSLDIWGVKGNKTAREMFLLILPLNFNLKPFPLNKRDVHVIIKTLHKEHNVEAAYYFLNSIQVITNHWMSKQGYSTGMMDGYVPEVIIPEIDTSLTEVETMIHLNSIRDKFQVPEDDNNTLIKMIRAGSKGSAINYIQTAFMLGQQTIYGKRLHRDIKKGGFITSNFFNGLTSQEMFILARCARVNIADTAIKTPEAGYLGKQFCQMLENVVYQYDGTCRKGKDIISLNNYGNVEYGTNVGVIAGQCLSEPCTQMSLDSFHYTGIDSMEKMGFPRIKELSQCSEKEIFVTTTCTWVPQLLLKDCFDFFLNAPKQPSWEVRFLKAFPRTISKKAIELRQTKYLTIKQMEAVISLLSNYKITHSNYFQEGLCIRVYDCNENLANLLIDGTLGILSKKGNDYVIDNERTYKLMLSKDGRATTNSVKLMNTTFGIAATYEFLCKEFKKVMSDINKRHYELLASCMCFHGAPRSTKTLNTKDPSPMAKAAYQRSTNVFIQAAIKEEVEENKSISSKIAMGYLISTNVFQIIEDEEKMEIIEKLRNNPNKVNVINKLKNLGW